MIKHTLSIKEVLDRHDVRTLLKIDGLVLEDILRGPAEELLGVLVTQSTSLVGD